jgi:exportin-1
VLYVFFMQQLHGVLPPGTDIPSAYEQGSDEDQAFVQNLALFFTTFLKVRI